MPQPWRGIGELSWHQPSVKTEGSGASVLSFQATPYGAGGASAAAPILSAVLTSTEYYVYQNSIELS